MPFTKVYTGALIGLEAKLVEVEVNVDYMGFPSFTIVGLPSKEIEEAKERVRSAIKNSKAKFPDAKITVNLSPADLAKKGSSYDLPIAIGILSASGQIIKSAEKYFLFGELSLDGHVNKIRGVIPIAELAANKFEYVIAPEDNGDEVSMIPNIKIKLITNLQQIISHMNGKLELDIFTHQKLSSILNEDSDEEFSLDYCQIKGLEHAKRAIEISIAGGHSIALSGPPGSGKTLIARSIPTVLPNLNEKEAFEILKIDSVLGDNSWIDRKKKKIHRPFRNPHHTTSIAGLVGGGNPIGPGEITLAHNGVLFLDEFTEFDKSVIDSLRQPIESKNVVITRANGTARFPCDFILVVAFNLCPCGYYGHPKKICTCSEHLIKSYLSKISGPILDRIDLHVTCIPSEYKQLSSDLPSISSLQMKERIKNARNIQLERYKPESNLSPIQTKLNAELNPSNINKYVEISDSARNLLNDISPKINLSARAYHRIIKVSRTIADLDVSKKILDSHILEAIQYRKSF